MCLNHMVPLWAGGEEDLALANSPLSIRINPTPGPAENTPRITFDGVYNNATSTKY